ncbi:tyrosine transporter TyrP, partial [Plesiomonas shigelloides]
MKSRVLGSVLLLAGLTIGAGMLAMPFASAGIGFIPTLFMMFALRALMCYSALMLVEVPLSAPDIPALSVLAERYLGKQGRWLISFSMLFLMYALTAVYATGGGVQLTHNLERWVRLHLTPVRGALL